MKSKKESILKAAVEIISQKGYHGATMDDIADKAEVAKGTLYYHFKSKEDVFNFIIESGIDLIKKEINIGIKNVSEPKEKMEILSRILLKLICSRSNFFKIVISQLWGQELRQSELRKSGEYLVSYFEEFIKELIDTGIIKNKDSRLMTYTFIGDVCSTAIYKLLCTSENSEEIIIEDELIDHILKVLICQ